MFNYLKDFFSWSKKERIGVIALSILLLTLFLLNFFFDRWFSPKMETWNADSLAFYSRILDSLEKDVISKNSTAQQKQKSIKLIEKNKIKYYPFDPNKIGKQEWIQFGFSEKQAQIILKYKRSIKGFKSKEDLGRCFVIDSIKMNELRPYIQIDTILFQEDFIEKSKMIVSDSVIEKKNKEIENLALVELNEADSIQLLSISGIGPYFSNKIISYRNLLGGYFRKEQLLEIWNFDSTRYLNVYNQILIDTNLIVKININQIEVDALKAHPYIRWSLANAIVKYRFQHGKYISVEDKEQIQPHWMPDGNKFFQIEKDGQADVLQGLLKKYNKPLFEGAAEGIGYIKSL